MSEYEPLLNQNDNLPQPPAQTYGPPPPPQDFSTSQGLPPNPPSYQHQPPPAQYHQDGGYQVAVAPHHPSKPVVVNNFVTFREIPVQMRCPNCQQDITTHTRYKIGLLTWLAVGAMFIFGHALCLCLIPFCINSLKDVVHICPICNHVCGKYDRIG